MFLKIKIFCNNLIVRLINAFFFSIFCPPARIHYDLVLVRFDSIGDFIIGLDGIRAYRKVFKGKRILYICKPYTGQLARKSNLFTEVIEIDNYQTLYYKTYFEQISKIRRISADYVINPTWSRLDPSDWVVHAIRSKNKYGCHGDEIFTQNWKKGDGFYTRLIRQAPQPSEFHYAQHFINNTIDTTFKARLPRLDLIYSHEAPLINRKYIVVGISAQFPDRIWPMDRLASIIDNIPEKYNIVLIGYNALDLKNAAKLESLVKNPSRIVNMVDKTSIMNMFNLISNAQFVIGMDSAPVHIAAAARVRSICIAPGAHFKRFVPYPKELGETEFHPRTVYKFMDCFNCGYHCSYPGRKWDGALPCLLNVTVEMVKNELDKLLKEI